MYWICTADLRFERFSVSSTEVSNQSQNPRSYKASAPTGRSPMRGWSKATMGTSMGQRTGAVKTRRSNVLGSKSGCTSIRCPPGSTPPVRNSVRAALAISWPPTPPAPNDRPRKLAYAFSSSAAFSDGDPVC